MARKNFIPLFPDLKSESGPSMIIEQKYLAMGYVPVAGVDEAGRGPLAGPVVAAAVVLPGSIGKNSPLWKVRDSKTLTVKQREQLYWIVVQEAKDLSWAMCDPDEIDQMNILAASLEAMRKAVMALDPRPRVCLVDGNQAIPCRIPSVPVIKGDRRCLSIAAASILAKVVRDQIMEELHKKYPGYGFAFHKGYATAEHKQAIIEQGPSPVHRRTFRGVKECI